MLFARFEKVGSPLEGFPSPCQHQSGLVLFIFANTNSPFPYSHWIPNWRLASCLQASAHQGLVQIMSWIFHISLVQHSYHSSVNTKPRRNKMSSPQPRAPTNTPTRHDATSPVNLDKVNNKFTTHDSIHQAQLALERHITETSNSRMSHPSLYESMVAAQLVNQRHTKGPVKSVKHGYQVQSLDKGQLSDSLHELPLDQNYLAQLRRDTRDAWPKIHEGIRAEEEYYQTLLTQIGPDQAGVDYAGFATLSRVYGPVKIKEPLPKISQGIWVEEYKVIPFSHQQKQ